MRTPRLLVSLALAGLVVALAPSAADAKCAAPRTFAMPADGTALPPEPTLWLFVPGWPEAQPEVQVTDGDGNALEATVALVSESGIVRALRIDVPARSGELVVSWQQEHYAGEARYTIDKEPAQEAGDAALAPVEIVGTQHEQHAWTCSHQDTLNLKLDQPAAAYRLEWAASDEAWLAGERDAVILPPQMDAFFSPEKASASAPGVVELGHVNCTGDTIEWPASGRIHVGLVAIGLDGRETPLPAEPVLLTCKSCE